MEGAKLHTQAAFHQDEFGDRSGKGPGNPEVLLLLLAAFQAQALKEPLSVYALCEVGSQ